MWDKMFSAEALEETVWILQNEFPLAVWETVYVTVIATAFAILLGLPLGVLLVAGEKDGVLPLPKGVMHVLNIVINLLRSMPFLILMIMVFPPNGPQKERPLSPEAQWMPQFPQRFPLSGGSGEKP